MTTGRTSNEHAKSRLRIGFDVSLTGRDKAGCGHYTAELIRHLATRDTTNEYLLYPNVGDVNWDPQWENSAFNSAQANFRCWSVAQSFAESQSFWRNPGSDFEARLGRPDIVHANSFFCPHGLNHARLVYTLYDLSFIKEPAWSTEDNRTACFAGVFRASLTADLIIAISEFSRCHFLTTFPHYPEDRVKLVYPASRFADAAVDARPERFAGLPPESFWLCLGTIEPRKNHRRLLEAYRTLKTICPEAPPLVLAGGSGWLMDSFPNSVDSSTFRRNVIMPGYVSEAELSWLLRNCFALVYPSLFEGFGMPVAEALSVGTPVICSNTSSLPEVAGDAALYCDPLDPQSIAAAMKRLWTGEVDRQQLKNAAVIQARRFSWDASAAQLLKLYEHVMSIGHLHPAPGH